MTTEADRLAQLESAIPDVWENKTVLYIGANVHRFHFRNQLSESRSQVDVLEIDPQRCEDIREANPWVNRVICGDVRRVDRLVKKPYDLVFWSHGPTCLGLQYIAPTIYRLQDVTNHLLVLMCPWGRYHYTGKENLSPHDVNRTPLDQQFFMDLGFLCTAIGARDENGSNLLAWMRK